MFFFLEKYCVPCFCLNSQQQKRCHWYCPECQHILCRAPDFKKHLQNHGVCNFTSFEVMFHFDFIHVKFSSPHLFCIVCRSCCYKQNDQQASVCAFDTGISECLIFIGLCLHIVFTYLSIVPQKGHHQKTQRQGSMSRSSHL